MKLPRRNFLRLTAGASVLSAASRIAWAQAYPTRPVRIIVGFPPGGPGDIVTRLMGQWLSERLGPPFIVENRAGAAGNIGTEAVVRAPADGYTLLLTTVSNAVNATLYDKLNFNFIRDTAPVAGVVRVPNVMEVNPSFPAKTAPEFIAYAKANPNKLNFGSGGNGTASHMQFELFKLMSGVSMVHVPYRGSAPALTDLLSGQVQLMFDPMPSSIGHIKAGKLRALAVTTATRSEVLPDLPTLRDSCPTTRRAHGLALSRRRTRLPKSSRNSTTQSTRALLIPRSRRGSLKWAAWCLRVRLLTSASSSPKRPTSGAR